MLNPQLRPDPNWTNYFRLFNLERDYSSRPHNNVISRSTTSSDACTVAYRLERAAPLLALIFLLLLLVIEVTSMWNMSSTYDERGHLRFGDMLLTNAELVTRSQKMPITFLNALPIRLANYFGVNLSSHELFFSRLPTVFLSLLLATLVFAWSSKLYGSLGGLLSLILHTLNPNLLAHARLATTDLPCALFMFLSVYLFVRYLKTPSRRNLILAAVATGIAQVTKHTALLLFPAFAILTICYVLLPGSMTAGSALRCFLKSLRWRAVHAALFGFVVLLAINIGYGFNGSMIPVGQYIERFNPANQTANNDAVFRKIVSTLGSSLPRAYVEALFIGRHYNATGLGHAPNYLLGETSREGWWYYFLVAMGLKTPLGLFVLVLLSLWTLRRAFQNNPIDEWAMVLIISIMLVFFSLFCTAQIGIRYLLPIFPFVCVFLGKVSDYFRERQRFPQIFITLLLGWYAISALSFHPHYLSYFNELIGSRKNMYKYLADSNVDWGQSQYYLQNYLALHKDEFIAVNPPQPVTGKVVVNVNALVGIDVPASRYAWLRDSYPPIHHVAYSWLVFDVPASETSRRQNRESHVEVYR